MTEVVYDSEQPFNGIIAKILAKNSDSVRVEASDTEGDEYYPECLIEQGDRRATFWQSSTNKRDPYLLFEFSGYKVKLTGYVLQSGGNSTDDRDPATWIVVGSNDGEEWFMLDDQESTRVLTGAYVTEFFECVEKESEEAFKFIKIQMVEPNHRGDWTFRLGRVEFFGILQEE